jgi:hypothetical protein
VNGLVSGPDTVIYSVSNMCGAAVAMHYIDVEDCITGISMLKNYPTFIVFPNPVSKELGLEWANWLSGAATVIIENVTGQTVYKTALANVNTSQGSEQLDLSMLDEGIYILSIRSETFCYNYKIVVGRK